MTFIDDFSNYVWVHMLKKKSEVIEKFAEFVAMAENFSGKRVKKFRNDNGGEYINNALSEFCKERGILTEPYISAKWESRANEPHHHGQCTSVFVPCKSTIVPLGRSSFNHRLPKK